MKPFIVKIIHVINHPPAYEEYANDPNLTFRWETPAGHYIGISGNDWSDQLASEVLKITDEFEHEIWQPDLKADKIYNYTFKNGLIHRLFPAFEKQNKEIISPLMLTYLSSNTSIFNYIFHICYPHYLGLNKDLIDTYKNHKFILTFHGEVNLPINYLFRIQKNPFKKLIYLKQHFIAKYYFKSINHITYQSEKNINTLKKYYKGDLTKMTMGINTNKFKKLNKAECRSNLLINNDIKVLLTVSRLNGLKQIDKFIDVLKNVNENFLFIIVGHGFSEYEDFLREKARILITKNKIRFEGYKTSDELVEYYNAADLFIHISKSEAGPVSIMEAMACGIPVFCTDTGNTAEVIKKNNAGIIVGIKNYKEWKEKLIDYLKGKPIKALDVNIVKEHYNWKNIANKIITIYRNSL